MYSSDDARSGEQPLRQPAAAADSPAAATDSSAALNRLRSIARLRTADAGAYGVSREELERLKDVVDENLRKYHRHYDDDDDGPPPRSTGRKRPHVDPYIGQILDGLNGERHADGEISRRPTQQRPQMLPVRRKIIRHTVLAGPSNANRRMYGGVDGSSRIEWTSPWADYFPILINDPFQSVMNSFSEIIEYGPAADICRHGTALTATATAGDADRPDGSSRLKRSRRHATDEEKGLLRPSRPNQAAATTTEQPKLHWGGERPAAGEHNGDTGPQIKRLVVRRGGVAIAGPGGIATAGTGGTAIVGPGGTAYSTKDTASAGSSDVPAAGVSMAGYGPYVMQRGPPPPPPPGPYATYPYNGYADGGGTAVLSSDGVTYTFPVPSRGLTAAGTGSGGPSAPHAGRQISLPDGAKLIATGPIVYYNPQPAKRSRKGKKLSPRDRKRGSAVGARR